MPTVVITGANVGIGLGLAEIYAAAGWRVHATARKPDAADELKALAGDVHVHRCDVTDPNEIAGLSDALGTDPVDILINNAGIYGPLGPDLSDADYKAWEEAMRVNVLGPIRVTTALLENVKAGDGKMIANLSSRMGSITQAEGDRIPYRSTKAALNAAMRNMAINLEPSGVTVLLLHPGWVQTRMGGSAAPVTVPESIQGLKAVLDNASIMDTGKFINYDGTQIEW
jgi:NAD(P)-dependent dehydrogenase (short-subunit alcohol dehydrogenase family)